MRMLWIAGCFFAAGTMFAAAPDEAALRAAMKQIGPATGALSKKITAKDATAADDAKKMAAWFAGDVQKFWKAKKAPDAVTYAKTASAEFKMAGKLASAGKWDDAMASFKKATATCGGCHKEHREKSADGFKVK